MKKFLDDIGLSYFWDKIKTYVDNKTVSVSVDLNLLYPIGRGFIDFTDTDYSNWLGFTWERELIGVSPVGLNPDDEDFNTIGKKGGEKTHTLTISEMPSHRHTTKEALCTRTTTDAGNNTVLRDPNRSNAGSITSTGYVSYVGNGTAHNNMHPYQVVAYWKRVA